MADEIVSFVTMRVRGAPEFVRTFKDAANAADKEMGPPGGFGHEGVKSADPLRQPGRVLGRPFRDRRRDGAG